jgi:hypothetical protein
MKPRRGFTLAAGKEKLGVGKVIITLDRQVPRKLRLVGG